MAIQVFQVGVKALIRNDNGEILMVHLPKWGENPEHWDLPGGRIDDGESFLDTLNRELQEEVGTSYIDTPHQLTAMISNIVIPNGASKQTLIIVVYETKIDPVADIKLDPNSAEDDMKWFDPKTASANMATKFTPEFCQYIRNLD